MLDNNYLDKGKEVLKLLISNGAEAYFIGGVVRSYIMSTDFKMIDINTSATPDTIKEIFNFTKVEDYKSGSVHVVYHGYDFIISTFKKEEFTDKRTPNKFHYSKSLLEDLSSRDYTINAIAMNHSGKLTDAYQGFRDINKKRICCIGKTKTRFIEDPIRMLRGIRFVSELNFKLVSDVTNGIKAKSKLIANASILDIADEMKKLIEGKYAKKAFRLLVDTKLYKYIPGLKKGIAKLANKYTQLTFEEFLLLSFVLNGKMEEEYLEKVENIETFKKAFFTAISNPRCKFDNLTLFANGLDNILAISKVNRIIGKNHNKDKNIKKAYDNLIVKKPCDLAFKGEDILKLTNGENGEVVQVLFDDILGKVLNKELENDYETISLYARTELEKANAMASERYEDYEYHDEVIGKKEIVEENDLDSLNENLEYKELDNATSEKEIEETLRRQGEVIKDFTEHRIDMLERRLNEQEQLLQEKDRKYDALYKTTRQYQLENDIDNMVKNNLEMLKEMNYLNITEDERVVLRRKLHQVYLDFISKTTGSYNNGNEED